jgi:hypothetical protein
MPWKWDDLPDERPPEHDVEQSCRSIFNCCCVWEYVRNWHQSGVFTTTKKGWMSVKLLDGWGKLPSLLHTLDGWLIVAGEKQQTLDSGAEVWSVRAGRSKNFRTVNHDLTVVVRTVGEYHYRGIGVSYQGALESLNSKLAQDVAARIVGNGPIWGWPVNDLPF